MLLKQKDVALRALSTSLFGF